MRESNQASLKEYRRQSEKSATQYKKYIYHRDAGVEGVEGDVRVDKETDRGRVIILKYDEPASMGLGEELKLIILTASFCDL